MSNKTTIQLVRAKANIQRSKVKDERDNASAMPDDESVTQNALELTTQEAEV